ncbi:MAG TPA: hypothetical protein VGQ07_08505, partial [Nitrospirales bacterium]|nr:hypothetical protein [Nitrospirales bacterium]
MKVSKWTIGGFVVLAYLTIAMVGMTLSDLGVLVGQAGHVSTGDRAAAKVAPPVFMPQTFSGTIEGIDPTGLRVFIQTEMGMKSLPVSNAEVIQRLTLGDQVIVEWNKRGYVLTIVKNNFTLQPRAQ